MSSRTRLTGLLRMVQGHADASKLSQSDFAWEILRRRADYHGGPPPYRRAIGRPGGQPVTLIECSRPVAPSWGLRFRRKSTA
jgi:hypothetical protein